ncbi:MAG: ATP-binding cassette domain-containing protein [Blautia sp.]
MLELDHIQKKYHPFMLDCSLKLEEGCVTGLIGQNGAGKSTTFKAILDLIRLDGGNIQIFGKNHKELSMKDKERIGVVLSDAGFSGFLTILDIIPVLEAMYHAFQKEEFQKQCQRFSLPMDKPLKEFSTGMQAKLKLLIAMSYHADLLILDEPTSGLDVVARDELLDMLRGYMEVPTHSILISSHISSDLEGLCDDIYMIHEGKIILHEETDVLLDQYGLLKMDQTAYASLDKQYLLAVKQEAFGYCCLTNEKNYYMENYPDIVIEKGSIDELITMIVRGENI